MKNILASRPLRLLLVLLVTAIAVAAALSTGRLAFAWVLVSLSCAAMAVCALIPKLWVTYASLVCMSFFATCAGVEFFYYFTSANDNIKAEGSYSKTADPLLGYAPAPQAAAMRSTRTLKDTLIYDVTYTSKADGWRVTPEHPGAQNAALFFGCSYTMGEGVNDAESYPYRVGQLLGEDWQVYNFGFSGYGPHQFLALLESGRLDELQKKYKKIHVFWMNIPGHELRSGGYSFWDPSGPRYVLENGVAVRRGNFDSYTKNGLLAATFFRLQAALKRTQLCNEFLVQVLRWNADALSRLQCAILVAAQKRLQQHWPNATFTVLVYPSATDNLPLFRQAGLPVLDTTPFMPHWPDDALYRIPIDRHPTARAYADMADGLADYLRGAPAK